MPIDENDTPKDEITSLAYDESGEKEPKPLLVTVEVPKGALDPQGKDKGFGFAKIGKSDLNSHPEIIDGIDLTPGLADEFERHGVFVHVKSIDGMSRGEPLAGAQIIPLSIRRNPQKGKYEIARAQTQKRHQEVKENEVKNKEAERIRALEKAEKDRVTEGIATQCLESLKTKGYNLPDNELRSIAKDAATTRSVERAGGTWEDATIEDKIARAHSNATYRQKSNEFETELPKYRLQAEQVALEVGGRIDESYGSIRVVVEADTVEFPKWQEAYGRALSVDVWLTKKGMLERDPNANHQDGTVYLGRFTGAGIKVSYWEDDGDMWNRRGGSSGLSYFVIDEPEEPLPGVVIWDMDSTQGLNDKRSIAASEKQKLQGSVRWIDIASAAELYKEGIVAAEERLRVEKEAAVENIKWLISKVRPERASAGEEITGNWLGMKAVSRAQHDHTGGRGGYFVSYSCIVAIPGHEPINLEKPETWPNDVRETARLLQEAWKNSQPEEAVVSGETKDEAVYRLLNFPYDIESLPAISGMQWRPSYQEARAYLDADTESLIPEMPDISGEWDPDKRNFYTHDLVLSGGGIEDIVMGSIILRQGRRDPGYLADVTGFPHYKIKDFIDAHPEADPRQLRLSWRAVIPSVIG